MSLLRRSLVGRITLASAIAAALGGAGSALSAGFTARELGAAHESAELLRVATDLADELDEELSGGDDDDDDEEDEYEGRLRTPGALLAHELEDVRLEGARASLWSRGTFVAGDPSLPALAPGACQSLARSVSLRACAVAVGDQSLITLAVTTHAERARDALLVRALAVGTLGGALFGALLSYLLARWALSPLTELRDRVRQAHTDAALAAGVGSRFAEAEVEELRSAVAELIERLGTALVQAQAFAAEAAHELRTPLTTIGGELELLEDGAIPHDPGALARVRAQVGDLTTLVQRLLVLAQPAPLDPTMTEVVDLSDVLSAVEQALPSPHRARLRTSIEEDVLVRGDASLLRALVGNALENAFKFSSGAVEANISAGPNEAWIDVIDRGPGVSESERERVFIPFYRGPSARATTLHGHGLGLSLIARVAWRHGGRAEFLERSSGAHLRVSLPVLRGARPSE